MRIALLSLLMLLPSTSHAQLFRRPVQRQRYVQPRVNRPAPEPTLPSEPPDQQPLTTPATGVPLAAVQEIARLGDSVQEIGTGHQGLQTLWMAAMAAPPPDDSHKWYITVIRQRGCAACDRLLTDFARHPELKAFADTAEHSQSWSHFNVFAAEDQTQRWRWAKIKIEDYPTLLLQPPLNRKFGDPRTVVLQKTGYSGDAAALAEEMRRAIKYYISKRDRVEGGMQQAIMPNDAADATMPPAPVGIDPPFVPPSPPETPSVLPSGPPVIPSVVPVPRIAPDLDLPGLATALGAIRWVCGALIGVLTSGGITNLFLLLILLLLALWALRARRPLDLVLDETLLQRLGGTLAAIVQHRSSARPAAPLAASQATRASPAVAPVARHQDEAPKDKHRPTNQRARVHIR